jgi:hypothetical protein
MALSGKDRIDLTQNDIPLILAQPAIQRDVKQGISSIRGDQEIPVERVLSDPFPQGILLRHGLGQNAKQGCNLDRTILDDDILCIPKRQDSGDSRGLPQFLGDLPDGLQIPFLKDIVSRIHRHHDLVVTELLKEGLQLRISRIIFEEQLIGPLVEVDSQGESAQKDGDQADGRQDGVPPVQDEAG